MSEEQRQNRNGEEHCSEDEQIENLEAENINLVSNSNDKVEISHDASGITAYNLLRFVSEGSEIQPSDVLAIEELPHELLNGQSSNERLGGTVLYESATESEDESTKYPQAYSDNSIESSEHFDEVNIAKKRDIREVTGSEEKWVPTFLMQYNRCEEIRGPVMPVVELSLQNGGIAQYKCPDYGSDEFADTEDDAKDSSSSDNNESASEQEIMNSVQLKKHFMEIQSKKGEKDEFFNLDKAMESNPNSSENNNLACKLEDEKFPKKNEFSYFSENTYQFKSISKISNEDYKKFEASMPTIAEAPELEKVVPVSQSSHSKANRLKMKTSVVKRTDRCHVCNAKLGLCAIKCRCGGYYCAKHRYDKEHGCTFDYKSLGADEIRKNNPRIIAEKIRKL